MDHNILFIIIFLIYISGVYVAAYMMFNQEYTLNIKRGMDEETAWKEAMDYMKYDTETEAVILSWVLVILDLIIDLIYYLYHLIKTKIKKH